MKNGNITFEDIEHHVPENWTELYEGQREWLIGELRKRVNATNRINAQAALKPTSLNRRCKEFQKYYAALSSLTFDQMQLYKQIFKNEKILKTLEAKQTLVFSDKGLLKVPESTPYTFGRRNEGPWVPDREFIGPLLDEIKFYLYQDLL